MPSLASAKILSRLASLFSASTYTFTFEIFTRTGGANLTITNPWYNPVEYSGSISQLY